VNHLVEYQPGRMVEVEQVYTCQRYPEGVELVHKTSRRPVIILELQFQGWWLSYTARFHTDKNGRPLERYLVMPMYLVRVPSLHEVKYLGEEEMHAP
jgi:hypothetical protein